MKGSEFIKTLPPNLGQRTPTGWERDKLIYDAVDQGHAVVDWFTLTVDIDDIRATFLVSNALQIGEPDDSVRPSTSPRNAQRIADRLNSVLPTMFLADQMYQQAPIKLDPLTMSITSSTAAMQQQSARLDQVLQGRNKTSLVANEGKHWLNHSDLLDANGKPTLNKGSGYPNGLNYGWQHQGRWGWGHDYPSTVPGVFALQGPYTAHDYWHVDYSQLVYLVARPVLFCLPQGSAVAGLGQDWTKEEYEGGQEDVASPYEGWSCDLPAGGQGQIRDIDIYDVIKNPTLRKFVVKGDEKLQMMRQPAVDWAAPQLSKFDPGWRIEVPAATAQPSDAAAQAGVGASDVGGKVAAGVAGGAVGYYVMEWLKRLVRGGK